MNFIFNGEIIDYKFSYNKNSNPTILLLHGWGGNKDSFITIEDMLKSKYSILSVTLPTISNTQMVWDMHIYKELLLSILKLHNVLNVIIICHSFGFRLATMLNKQIAIDKLIVTGGAGPKKTNIYKSITQNNQRILLNNKKYKWIYNKIASNDYKNLSRTNKRTFNNIVKVNTVNLIKFSCPILLFWGKTDKETPLWIAKKIKRHNTVKLMIVNGGHFAYQEKSTLFKHCIMQFLED